MSRRLMGRIGAPGALPADHCSAGPTGQRPLNARDGASLRVLVSVRRRERPRRDRSERWPLRSEAA